MNRTPASVKKNNKSLSKPEDIDQVDGSAKKGTPKKSNQKNSCIMNMTESGSAGNIFEYINTYNWIFINVWPQRPLIYHHFISEVPEVKTPGSIKKKNKKLSQSLSQNDEPKIEEHVNVTMGSSKKKKMSESESTG